MNLNEILSELHDESALLLLSRIKDGTATAAEIGQAINLLKHNNIQAPANNKPINSLLDSLPEFDEPEDAEGTAWLN